MSRIGSNFWKLSLAMARSKSITKCQSYFNLRIKTAIATLTFTYACNYRSTFPNLRNEDQPRGASAAEEKRKYRERDDFLFSLYVTA